MLRKAVPFDNIAHLIPIQIHPTDVLRLSGQCAGEHCKHFNNHRCSLASRVVASLAPTAKAPPACGLRSSCRWWRQEGLAVCLRCPQITTQPSEPCPTMLDLASPNIDYYQINPERKAIYGEPRS